MTWNNLLEHIKALTPEQCDTAVTIFDPYTAEYMAISSFEINTAVDVLDESHPFLILKA